MVPIPCYGARPCLFFLGTKVMPNLPKQARLGAKRYESGAYFFVMWDKDEVLKKQNDSADA